MQALMKSKKGNALTGTVITIVAVAILLFIALLVINNVRGSIDRAGWTAEENSTFEDVRDNTNTSFSLMAIALIVLVVFVIITILRG